MDLGVTYTVHLWLVGKRVVDFLLAVIELFSPALTVEALWADIGHNFGVRKGVGHFERKFQGKGWSSTNNSWCQKTRVTGLSRDVVCVILRLAVLIQYRCVTHTHTHTQTHTHTHTDTRSCHRERRDCRNYRNSIIIIIFYSPAQHKTNENNNRWIEECARRLPEKQTLIELAAYLVI